MLRWVHQRFPLGGIRTMISGTCLYVVRVLFGLGIPLFLFRCLVRGISRGKSVDDEESGTTKSTCTDTVSVSIPEPEQDNPCADEEEDWRVSPTDDYYCEYDSTWDTDSSEDQDLDENGTCASFRVSHALKSRSYKYERFQSAARDLHNYRHDYPIKPRQRWYYKASEVTNGHPNLDFYLGNRPSSPDNLYISDFHQWRGNYDTLESGHSYIQWLFPLQEPGLNPDASTLTKQELEEFRQNDIAKNHLLESYKIMLDFYGIELCDEKTGAVRRASNWEKRFANLNRQTHNNLRITRILKCLGTLGFTHYQAPLVQFFLEETLVNRELPKVKESVLNYFLFAVLDKKQRRSLLKFAFLNSDEREEFVWCPKKIQMKWSCLKLSKQPKASVEE